MINASWPEIINATLFPHIEFNFEYFFIITAIFGTTITPYMFFWESSTQVDEEEFEKIPMGENGRPKIGRRYLRNMRIDNAVGMVAAQLAQWFIIITTASVLFSNGIHNIGSAADAARALEPLVGNFANAGQLAKVLFAVGIIGLGFLGIPVLAGSAGYAVAEAMGWSRGLAKKFSQAKGFYLVIIFATIFGLLFNLIGIDPIKALVYASVFNGIAAVPLIFLIAKINSNNKVLGEHVGGILSKTFVWLTFSVMLASAIGLFYTFR
jgi:Mn2+/Fe2+ NRAMP family transporter